MAKQIEEENQAEPRRKILERAWDYSGDEREFLDTTRSIASSKSYSVRFSEDCSIASPDSRLMSTTTSRSGTSLASRLDNIQERPKTGSITSARSRSSPANRLKGNSPGINNRQPGSMVSKGPQSRSNSNLTNPASRNSSQDGRMTRSKSLGFDDRSNTAQSNPRTPKGFREEARTPSERRAVSALPNIGRGRERVNLPPRPKTSSSMHR